MPYSSGLNRNIVQCLEDNDIPLQFNHTVTDIHGKERVDGRDDQPRSIPPRAGPLRARQRFDCLRHAAAVRGPHSRKTS